jgi:hypothetical protein
MSYGFQDFIEAVRGQLARLLANPEFVECTCGAGAKSGLHRIHVDPELGFEVGIFLGRAPDGAAAGGLSQLAE